MGTINTIYYRSLYSFEHITLRSADVVFLKVRGIQEAFEVRLEIFEVI